MLANINNLQLFYKKTKSFKAIHFKILEEQPIFEAIEHMKELKDKKKKKDKFLRNFQCSSQV